MQIWIMRHGQAGANIIGEANRILTEEGKAEVEAQGVKLYQALAKSRKQFTDVLVSPYVRAEQTFQTLNKTLQAQGFAQDLQLVAKKCDLITPNGNPHHIVTMFEDMQIKGSKEILVISHLPLVHELVLTITNFRAQVNFDTGVIASIDFDNQKLLSVIEKDQNAG